MKAEVHLRSLSGMFQTNDLCVWKKGTKIKEGKAISSCFRWLLQPQSQGHPSHLLILCPHIKNSFWILLQFLHVLMFVRFDQKQILSLLESPTDVVLPVYMSLQALHHLWLFKRPLTAQRSSYWDVRHCDSPTVDLLPLPLPLHDPPPHPPNVILRCLCVVVGGLTACVWSHPGTSRIPRDFYLCPGVIFSVDKHDCSVLCSTLFSSITDTLSHMCYWLIVVVQLELELSVLWLKDTRKSRYVKLLHIYCIYFWFCGCLWSPKIPLSVCRSCSLLYAHTCVSHWRHQIAAAHQMLLTLNQQARHLQIEFTG